MNRLRVLASTIVGLSLSLFVAQVSAEDITPAEDITLADDSQTVAAQLEEAKERLLELNRDLLILEEELLFPANTQVAIFLSIDVGNYLKLDSVKVKVNDKLVASHLYTARQREALKRGGVQRLYIGNLKTGEHEVSAFFTGLGPEGREYKRATDITITKELDPKLLELKISDSAAKQQPQFTVKEWELF